MDQMKVAIKNLKDKYEVANGLFFMNNNKEQFLVWAKSIASETAIVPSTPSVMIPDWVFLGREEETTRLTRLIVNGATTISLIGPRRVGKSSLVLQVARNCGRFNDIIFLELYPTVEQSLENFKSKIGISSIEELLPTLLKLIKEGKVVVIDEFQYCYYEYNKMDYGSVFFSFIQGAVKAASDFLLTDFSQEKKGSIIVLGSFLTPMRLLEERIESPLYCRFMHRIPINPWNVKEQRTLFQHYGILSPKEMLRFRTLFDGMPFHYHKIHQSVGGLRSGIPFDNLMTAVLSNLYQECKISFLDDIGVENAKVLRHLCDLIGKNQMGTSISIEQIHVDGLNSSQIISAIEKLMNYYGMVEKLPPIFDYPSSEECCYKVIDAFLLCWLYILEKKLPNRSLWKDIQSGIEDLEGHQLEDWMHDIALYNINHERAIFPGYDDYDYQWTIHRGHWNQIRSKDQALEIDFIASHEKRKHVIWGSVKRNFSSLGSEGVPLPNAALQVMRIVGDHRHPGKLFFHGYTHSFVYVGLEEPAVNTDKECETRAKEIISKIGNNTKEIMQWIANNCPENRSELQAAANRILNPDRAPAQTKADVTQKVQRMIQEKQTWKNAFSDSKIHCYTLNDLLASIG
eukprot:TRINITY_DN3273_c0_g1_i1.p1 TRINITY_DN3273_c0_g1~~TRINITY_DN3273_c0_g1_i1.p1  ORF type:complete len:669 (-),score=74.29 TRINITY_DN3273_c0_g1_i1:30-1910(-)